MSIFAVPVLNVLWEMVAGHSFKREDVEVQKILKMMNWVFTSKVDYQKDATIFTCKIFCHDKSFDQYVKGVWDCNDDALGALHLSILHGIQQGEHKVILIQKDCALKSFRLYGLATHMIYQREKETRSKRF